MQLIAQVVHPGQMGEKHLGWVEPRLLPQRPLAQIFRQGHLRMGGGALNIVIVGMEQKLATSAWGAGRSPYR